MRYTPEHKQEARARITAAVARAFRRRGYGGIGVDGLAKEAGVTSGAFYGHFKSKDAAFQEIALQGLKDLGAAIADLQGRYGEEWVEAFIDFYLGHRRVCELGDSCGLQSLTPDVMRADATTRAAYEEELSTVVALVAAGLRRLDPALCSQRAIALLALLSGGVTLARSVATPAQSEDIAIALREAALKLVGHG